SRAAGKVRRLMKAMTAVCWNSTTFLQDNSSFLPDNQKQAKKKIKVIIYKLFAGTQNHIRSDGCEKDCFFDLAFGFIPNVNRRCCKCRTIDAKCN
ncbi:hypothetical protein, partial [Paenibacillus elgii]|uniref:hypothetical protein n=1 Tax=Paenibacillus elgii TaxID=189691 RepID=UPI001ED97CF0